MALCSQAFNSSTKRGCNYRNDPPAKKLCFRPSAGVDLGPSKKSVCIYSSSEEDNDSDDEQSCYNANQIRAKRRASSRVSFSLNSDLTKAVSQYSDDDEEIDSLQGQRRDSIVSAVAAATAAANPSRHSTTSAVNNHGGSTHSEDTSNAFENLDCKLSSSPISLSARQNSFLQISDSSKSSTRSSVACSDRTARSRCFEYLVGAIDEAWARYCDAATNVEDEVYGYNTPASVATDDEDYFGNTTDITDYESDFEHKQNKQKQGQFRPRLASSASMSSFSSTKEDPSSCHLLALKDRLTKAKYYLQDLVDSDDMTDVGAYWQRWDMIKYATIELVEDDDDDEVVETTIEELESGRLFVH